MWRVFHIALAVWTWRCLAEATAPQHNSSGADSANANASVPVSSPELHVSQLCPECEDIEGKFQVQVNVTLEGLGPEANGSAVVTCGAFPEQRAPKQTPKDLQHVTNSTTKLDLPAPWNSWNFTIKKLRTDTAYRIFCEGKYSPENSSLTVQLAMAPSCQGSSDECGVRARTMPSLGDNGYSRKFGMRDLSGVVLLMVYICWSLGFPYVRVIHETGVAVIGGIIMGVVLGCVFNTYVVFSYSFFSYFVLPMVIFNAGFNLQKKQFFKYSPYILALGVLGTVVMFVMIFLASAIFSHLGMKTVRYVDNRHRPEKYEEMKLTSSERLIMAAVLASTDTVAPIAFLPTESFPKLYAVVFGEGVLNDVVSVLLAKAAANSDAMPAVGPLLWKIVYYLVTSGTMGLVFGLTLSFIFRKAHDKEASLLAGNMKPLILLVGVNYTCYIVTEMCDISSIFALFVCSLVSGHYALHSLSSVGRDFAREFAEVLAFCAEAFVFGYFGLTSPRCLAGDPWAPMLVFLYVLTILLARALSMAIVTLVLRLAMGCKRLQLNCRELCIVGLAGSMRGTIAFALILHAQGESEAQQNMQEKALVSTVLFIVLVDTLVFGTAFPGVLKLFGLSQGERATVMLGEALMPPEARTGSQNSRTMSLNRGSPYRSFVRYGFQGCWQHIDNEYLKPFFRPCASRQGAEQDERGHELTCPNEQGEDSEEPETMQTIMRQLQAIPNKSRPSKPSWLDDRLAGDRCVACKSAPAAMTAKDRSMSGGRVSMPPLSSQDAGQAAEELAVEVHEDAEEEEEAESDEEAPKSKRATTP